MSYIINHVVWREFTKTGKVEIIRVETLNPRYYFKQLNYIKGTYIRKDKFRENINRKVEYIDPLITIDLNILPDLNSKEWIDKWKSLIREVGFMMIKTSGIPQKYMGNE